MIRTINVGKDFSRYPVGRSRKDGDSNGERFREDLLRPALLTSSKVRIELDDALGYNSSFLEEVFGGLVRSGTSADEIKAKVELITSDESLIVEIMAYLDDASASRRS